MSAVPASPAAVGSGVSLDPVRALQHALYRAAKADPGRRFHALYDKVCRRDVLWRAWVAVRSNSGAPGIDRITLAAVEEYGVSRLLDELASELREGRYRPLPARRVFIPKTGGACGGAEAAVDSHGTCKPPVRAGIMRFRNPSSRSHTRSTRCPGSGCGCCSSGSCPAGGRSAVRAGRWAR